MNNDKIKKLTEDDIILKSNTIHDIKWRIENRDWIQISNKIAMIIIDKLDELKITKEDFVEKSGIPITELNLIMKGSENITLETISKIKKTLKIKKLYI